MLNRFKEGAKKAGNEFANFSESMAKEVQESSSKGLQSFKLENECEKAAKILQVSFNLSFIIHYLFTFLLIFFSLYIEFLSRSISSC